MNKTYFNKIAIAGVLGMLAVIIGAFGAHGLKPKISPSSLNSFHTGVHYHYVHTLAALSTILLSKLFNVSYSRSFWSFIIGILFFSGSIYLLTTNDIHQLNMSKILGPMTPIGGIFFILGWLQIITISIKATKSKS